jgi:ribonuclease PH
MGAIRAYSYMLESAVCLQYFPSPLVRIYCIILFKERITNNLVNNDAHQNVSPFIQIIVAISVNFVVRAIVLFLLN